MTELNLYYSYHGEHREGRGLSFLSLERESVLSDQHQCRLLFA